MMIDPLHAWLNGMTLEHAVMILAAGVAIGATLITLGLCGIVVCIVVAWQERRDPRHDPHQSAHGDVPHIDLPAIRTWPRRGDRP